MTDHIGGAPQEEARTGKGGAARQPARRRRRPHIFFVDQRAAMTVSQLPWTARAALIRALGLKHCGGYGGQYQTISGAIEPRWCRKPFGHPDSCKYEFGGNQPGMFFRAEFRGFR